MHGPTKLPFACGTASSSQLSPNEHQTCVVNKRPRRPVYINFVCYYCSSILSARSDHCPSVHIPHQQTDTPLWPPLELNRTHKCPQAPNDGEDEGEDAVEVVSAVRKTLMTILGREGAAEVASRVEDEAAGTETAQAVAVDMRQKKGRRQQ